MSTRQKVLFEGRVQGVGFRYSTHKIAESFKVTGYVKNLEDGRVEVVAEGVESELVAFVSAIRERMSDYIRDVKIDSTDATDQFHEFEIRV